MQILSMAKLARNGPTDDIEDAAENAGHVLDAVIKISAGAITSLDAA